MNKPKIAYDMEDAFDEKKELISYIFRGLETQLDELQISSGQENINAFGQDILNLIRQYKELILIQETYKNHEQVRKYNQLNDIFIKKQLDKIFGE